jgi:hypothetical protein
MAASQNPEVLDLYEIGNDLERAGFPVRSFKARNFPRKRDHLVMFEMTFAPLGDEWREAVTDLIGDHGGHAFVIRGDGIDYAYFSYPSLFKGDKPPEVSKIKPEEADLGKAMEEIRSAGFWVSGLEAVKLDDPRLDSYTHFDIVFQGVAPSLREVVEKILERHGFATTGGGTMLGDKPESDVSFMFKSSREAIRGRGRRSS